MRYMQCVSHISRQTFFGDLVLFVVVGCRWEGLHSAQCSTQPPNSVCVSIVELCAVINFCPVSFSLPATLCLPSTTLYSHPFSPVHIQVSIEYRPLKSHSYRRASRTDSFRSCCRACFAHLKFIEDNTDLSFLPEMNTVHL